MAIKPITVAQLNGYVKRILQTDPVLGNVSVQGEVSNLKRHGSGHIYFTLKDETSKINCFLPQDQIRTLRYELAEGLQIVAMGYVSVFERGGTYSLTIRDIEVEGKGNLSIAFEQLKNKLQEEGLFDQRYKKMLPQFPKKVAIITSETGAAVRDIIKVITQRNNIINIIVYPCIVQGPNAAQDISRAIDGVNQRFPDADVIIVGRGGGSMEELWAFNEEVVARSIFLSHIPVISAVGHETDFTIADFVADRRAATPTEAAQLASPETGLALQSLEIKRRGMIRSMNQLLTQMELHLERSGRKNLIHSIENQILIYQGTLEHRKSVLIGRNPYEIMKQGYAAIQTADGRFASGATMFQPGDFLTVIFKDGKINCSVEEVLMPIEGEN